MNFKQMRYLQNLTVIDNTIYSYKTKVATINHDASEVQPLGWWSSTTSKHINYVGDSLGYKVLEV